MTISMNDFLAKQAKEQLNIIDLRSNYLYRNGNIKNSINIPYNYLLLTPEKYLSKKETYYLYCEYGSTSKFISNRLNSYGYQTISIDTGYIGYKISNN